ncbi:MAG: 4-(cytidine 5'-diphospho)-2-C-methyl-D-erythritol kinase [Verrucomicrobiae bacterium]|nr:4-(cytidine 5'-diphospho)-2-C-methyl-D-erythritol kinase [Verrucomicrobiae bacterium]MDW8343234.1 4-(cytidine 5'-diphospho)-2-C-methyl-D-erythritol kinase [Verrucomicrobiae bacterium]
MTTQASRGRNPTQLTLLSPAKINLYLRIVGKRPDGYHEVETVMVPLDFGDTVTLQLRKTSITVECDNPNLPTDESNLALRAAKLMAERFPAEKGVKINLQKRIPLAAGLGGGSSNAATVLRGLNRLWQLELPVTDLDPLAAEMGSDINFFLRNTAAVCRGRGEQVEPIPSRLAATVLMVNPGFGISTAWAYQHWAELGRPLTATPPDTSLLCRALESGDLEGVTRALYNDLERPALWKFPVLELIKDAMREAGAAGALMSGSGATVFGLFAKRAQADEAAGRIRAQFGAGTWTQVCGISQGLEAVGAAR